MRSARLVAWLIRVFHRLTHPKLRAERSTFAGVIMPLEEQVTAQLPMVRVSSDSHRTIYPFAAVGLDYFGPLYVRPEWAQNNIGEECNPKQALWMHIYYA